VTVAAAMSPAGASSCNRAEQHHRKKPSVSRISGIAGVVGQVLLR
jgi:hypothetical protein